MAPRYAQCFFVDGLELCAQISDPANNNTLSCALSNAPGINSTSSYWNYYFTCLIPNPADSDPTHDDLHWFTCSNCCSLDSCTDTSSRCYLENPPDIALLSATSCNSASAILGMFAAVNFAVATAGMVLGHWRVTRWLSCGCLGREDGKSYLYMWLVQVGLQLVANAAIAGIITCVPGFEHLAVGKLILLLTARPRVSWMFLAWAYIANKGFSGAAKSSTIAEFVLLAIATYPMVSVLSYAQNNLEEGLTIDYSLRPLYASVMFAGAFLYMFWAVPLILLGLSLSLVFTDIKLGDFRQGYIILSTWVLPTLYLGSWLFWAGFIKISSKEYVHPRSPSPYTRPPRTAN